MKESIPNGRKEGITIEMTGTKEVKERYGKNG